VTGSVVARRTADDGNLSTAAIAWEYRAGIWHGAAKRPICAGRPRPGGTAAVDAKSTLRLTVKLPLRRVLGQNIAMFKAEVENATNGEIEIQFFNSGHVETRDRGSMG